MEIKSIINRHYDCIDANLATIAHALDREYYLIFYNYFYFKYEESPQRSVSHDICTRKDSNGYPILDKYHGIESRVFSSETRDNVMQFIKRSTKQDRPVMIKTDVFYCPWTTLYHKQHITHYVLLSQSVQKDFVCLDPFFTTDEIIIEEDALHLKETEALTFMAKQTPVVTKNAVYSLLLEGIHQYKVQHLHEQFQNLSSAITCNNFDLELERSINLYDLPLIRKLRWLEHSRLSYIEMLTKIQGNYRDNALQPFIEEIHIVCNQWQKLRNLLLKCHIKSILANKQDALNILLTDICTRETQIHRKLHNHYFSMVNETASGD